MRFGVIGVGGLASVRVEALRATGAAELVAVAARRPERAARLVDQQRRAGVVVEAGYEARYKSVWLRSAEILRSGVLGELVSVRANAGYDQPEGGWYSDQEASGGVLVTRLSYVFLSPLRQLLGDPRIIAATGSAKRFHAAGAVRPDTVMALAAFPSQVVAAMTASYVKPSDFDDWNLLLVGTDGALEIHPGDMDGGHLRLSTRDTSPVVETFPSDGFAGQAAAFTRAVDARRGRESGTVMPLLNPPTESVIDLELCAEIDAMWDQD